MAVFSQALKASFEKMDFSIEFWNRSVLDAKLSVADTIDLTSFAPSFPKQQRTRNRGNSRRNPTYGRYQTKKIIQSAMPGTGVPLELDFGRLHALRSYPARI